jgi:hypothetical protein
VQVKDNDDDDDDDDNDIRVLCPLGTMYLDSTKMFLIWTVFSKDYMFRDRSTCDILWKSNASWVTVEISRIVIRLQAGRLENPGSVCMCLRGMVVKRSNAKPRDRTTCKSHQRSLGISAVAQTPRPPQYFPQMIFKQQREYMSDTHLFPPNVFFITLDAISWQKCYTDRLITSRSLRMNVS